jgi:hypothetical protein
MDSIKLDLVKRHIWIGHWEEDLEYCWEVRRQTYVKEQ